jgi:hypothetical protein
LHRYALIRVGEFEVAKGGGVWVAIGGCEAGCGPENQEDAAQRDKKGCVEERGKEGEMKALTAEMPRSVAERIPVTPNE